MSNPKVLECSSKGDKRFSAFYAKVELFGEHKSIEEHYQLSKIYLENDELKYCTSMKEAKGKKAVAFVVNNKVFDKKYLSAFYDLLWVKYLKNNKVLVDYAKGFDVFNDMFAGKSINCQARTIENYVKNGPKSIMKRPDVTEFSNLLKSPHLVSYVNQSLIECDADIICHQTNCQGVMGAGLAKSIKEKYPMVYQTYRDVCNKDNSKLLGTCLLISEKGKVLDSLTLNRKEKIVANLFGQFYYGRNSKHTDEKAVEKALISLKRYAKEHCLSVGLPDHMGCKLGGGDWNEVSKIIEKIFTDYPVTIYKYNN